jgi:Fe-S cluster assembly protein SufD
MSSFMQQPLAEAAQRAPHWLQSLQARGREQWQGTSLPTRRSEHWKYTALTALRDDYRTASPRDVAPSSLPQRLQAGLGGARLVFVDGVYQPTLSADALPEGISLCHFSAADDDQAARIAAGLDATIDAQLHPFAALNSAALTDGVLLEVQPGAAVEQPVEILWLLRAAEHPVATTQRLLVLVGENSRATVVEHFLSLDGAQPSFTNGLTELHLAPGAQLAHFRLHEESGEALHVGGVHARLDRDSQLDGFHLALGSRLKRLDLVVNHAGPGAHSNLNGVYLPRGEEHIDYHTTIEHAVPHCSTDEVFRGIVADRASAVFNGRIHIHPQAQKTRAELSNKNLLTSTEAEVNTKPELEIYADDVQCAHGATVAQLDALSLHYLRTRGISRAEAEVMLSFGFINELIDGVALEPLRAYLRPLLAGRFARSRELARHLL